MLQNLLKKHKNTISERQLQELARYGQYQEPIKSMHDYMKVDRPGRDRAVRKYVARVYCQYARHHRLLSCCQYLNALGVGLAINGYTLPLHGWFVVYMWDDLTM